MSAPEASQFGRGIVTRLRVPGPPRIRRRPALIGSLASSCSRFASATARPVAVRRSLGGPEVVRVRSFRDANVAPPRWWTGPEPEVEEPGAPTPAPPAIRRESAAAALPARGLPKAVRRVPNEQTYTPGGIVAGLHAEVVNVRRSDATVAAGPMLMNHDRVRLNSPRTPEARAGAPAGNSTGNGSGPGASAPAVPGDAARAATAQSTTNMPANSPATPGAASPGRAAGVSGPAIPGRPAPAVSRFVAAVRRAVAAVLPEPARPVTRTPAARATVVRASAPAPPSAPSIDSAGHSAARVAAAAGADAVSAGTAAETIDSPAPATTAGQPDSAPDPSPARHGVARRHAC